MHGGLVFTDADVPDYCAHLSSDRPACAALADGPVSDTPEPVTPQAGIVGAEPDRDDADAVGHD